MKSKFRALVLGLILLFTGFGLGFAANEPFQVFINGQASKLQVQRDQDTVLVPLTIPVTAESEEWTLSVKRDDKAQKIEISMSSAKAKLRGVVDCYYCSGKGLCPNDYPEGSGRTYAGHTDSICNGTGRCYHCYGTGKQQ